MDEESRQLLAVKEELARLFAAAKVAVLAKVSELRFV